MACSIGALLLPHGYSDQQGCYSTHLRLYSIFSPSVLPPSSSLRVRTVPSGVPPDSESLRRWALTAQIRLAVAPDVVS